MLTSIRNTPWYLFFAAIILLFWRLGLALITPFTQNDSVWYLSQTFSLLRGEWLTSTFGHATFDPFLLPYMYGVLTVPFFGIAGASVLSLALWNMLLLVLIFLLVLHLLYTYRIVSLPLRIVLAIFFLTSTYLYGPRPEVLNIVLILLALVILPAAPAQSGQTARLVAIGLLTACVGIVQPVGAVFALLFFATVMVQRRFPIGAIVLYGAASVVWAALLYGPVILVNPAQWYTDFFVRFQDGDSRGVFDPLLFVKHTVYTPFVFVVYAITLIQRRDLRAAIRQIIPLIGMTVVLLLFSRSYYLVYIPIYILLMSLENASKIPQSRPFNILFAGIALAMPLISHYYPTLQMAEAPAYTEKVREVQAAARAIVQDRADTQALIWVEGQIGMEAIALPQGRLYYSYIRRMSGSFTLEPGDVLLLTTESAIRQASSQMSNSSSEIVVEEIVAPGTEGLLTFEPFRFERGPSVGLWLMRVRNADGS